MLKKLALSFLALFFLGCAARIGPSISVSKNLGYENKPSVGVEGQLDLHRGSWANVISLDAALSEKVQTGDGWGGTVRYETGVLVKDKAMILAGTYAHYQHTSVYEKTGLGGSLGLYAVSEKLTYGIRYDFPDSTENRTTALAAIFQMKAWRAEWSLIDVHGQPERGMRVRLAYLFPLDKKW